MIYDYENTINEEYWEKYLNREITRTEKLLFMSVKSEKYMNATIRNMNNEVAKIGLYIPMLTNLHGNCIFESLQYFKLCDDIDELRKGIALIMLIFKNKKFFIPEQELTLNELFTFRNDIEFVICKKTLKLYTYNFDAMCVDLATDSSWTRLNTELIFTVMAIVLNLKFKIIHNNGHCTTICINENSDTKTLHLALINEVHYFPLDVDDGDNSEEECPQYSTALNSFHNWARNMAIEMGRTYDNDSSSDNSSSDNRPNDNSFSDNSSSDNNSTDNSSNDSDGKKKLDNF